MKNKNLSQEVKDFNKKISCIVNACTIDIRNRASFILYIKNHKNDRNLKLLALIYLCDNRYIFEYIKKPEKLFRGEIARYVMLRMDLSRFFCIINSFKKKNADKVIGKQKLLYQIKQFHNKCNNYIYADRRESINLFIKEKILDGSINKEKYFEKMSEGNTAFEIYVKEEMKNILGYADDSFINDVDFIYNFYLSLKKNIEDEFNDESINIIASYLSKQ